MQYQIRDAQGNLYGPATIEMVRQWIHEGRITAAMLVAPEGSDQWQPAGTLPELAGAFGVAPVSPTAAGQAAASETVNVRPVQPGTPAGAAHPGFDVQYGTPGPSSNPLAITSLILGIASFIPGCVCCLWLPLGIGAIVTGVLANKQLHGTTGQSGHGMARAGIILGIIAMVLYIAITTGLVIYNMVSGHHASVGGIGRGF